jgi:hypothetical protein
MFRRPLPMFSVEELDPSECALLLVDILYYCVAIECLLSVACGAHPRGVLVDCGASMVLAC